MNKLFTEKVVAGSSSRFFIPLSENGKQYNLKDLRINALTENGVILRNGFYETTVKLDSTLFVDKDIASCLSGEVASIELNQVLFATTNINVSTNKVDGIVLPVADPIKYIVLSFLVDDSPIKK